MTLEKATMGFKFTKFVFRLIYYCVGEGISVHFGANMKEVDF